MEELLHYVWKHKLFPLSGLSTIDGKMVEVIDPGLANPNAGPDFSGAKVNIGGIVWAGNVELHLKASDWFLHHHDEDARYDSIVLHVVEESDATIHRRDGQLIPQLVLPVPVLIRSRYDELLHEDHYPPCYRSVGDLKKLTVHNWLTALTCERLEMRCGQIQERYAQHGMNWNDALFATLARGYGFGVNGDAFEAWARSLDFRAVDKHRDHLMQVEAIFFGQAGLLNPEALPASHRDEAARTPYYQELCQEYAFLRHKFGLTPITPSLWRFARMRPDNSPFVRMAQLAMLYHEGRLSVAALIEAPDGDALRMLLRSHASAYWDTHFSFGATPTAVRQKVMGESNLTLLLMNVVAPFLFAYGRHKGNEAVQERALAVLEALPAEDNTVIRSWRECGLTADNAADSQALIHLKRLYCERKDCLRCRIGYHYLKRKE